MNKTTKLMGIKELKILGKVFDAFEKTFDTDTEVVAEMFDYDNEYVDIKVTDKNGDDVCFKMPRKNLLNKMSIKDKADSIV